MNQESVYQLVSSGLMLAMKMALPIILVALGVGILVALFQALTTIQEMTLTFVPKIIFVFLAISIFFPYISNILVSYTQSIYSMISTV